MNHKYYLKFWTHLSKRKEFITDKAETVHEIDFKKLKKDGSELIIFDYDDTLTDYHGSLSTNAKTLIQALLNQGFEIAIHSNFNISRQEILMKEFSEWPSIFVQITRDKPDTEGYKQIMDYFGKKPESTIMIGDRVATDIFGAYLSGIKKRILIKSYSDIFGGAKTNLPSRIIRKLEIFFCNL